MTEESSISVLDALAENHHLEELHIDLEGSYDELGHLEKALQTNLGLRTLKVRFLDSLPRSLLAHLSSPLKRHPTLQELVLTVPVRDTLDNEVEAFQEILAENPRLGRVAFRCESNATMANGCSRWDVRIRPLLHVNRHRDAFRKFEMSQKASKVQLLASALARFSGRSRGLQTSEGQEEVMSRAAKRIVDRELRWNLLTQNVGALLPSSQASPSGKKRRHSHLSRVD